MNVIAFIPARSGSKRLKNKNILKLNGHPLLAYTVRYAKKVNLFSKIFCISDSKKYMQTAKKYGADDFVVRPKKISGSKSSDVEWIKWAEKICKAKGIKFDTYAILRPTNPFRTKSLIKEAFYVFKKNKYHSVRAVEKTKIHPGKIWKIKNKTLIPIINKKINGTPWHSSQYASLPTYYSQNASLELCSIKILKKFNQFAGKKIYGLISKGYDGFDINYPIDFKYAEEILKKNKKISKFLDLK